jgi:hypothetical protein
MFSLQGSQRAFSRKGPSMKDLLQSQKTKLEDSELDMFGVLSRQPALLEKLQTLKRAGQGASEERAYRAKQALKALKASLPREYEHERSNYKPLKKVANLITEMGFVISEGGVKDGAQSKFHRLIKQTDRHLIVVTFNLRRRLIKDPQRMQDMYDEGLDPRQVEGESFGDFLKRHGLVPPDMMGYDERQQ